MDSGHGCRIKGGLIKFRSICRLITVAAALLSGVPRISAQHVSMAAVPSAGDVYGDSLTFSKDGRVLREVRSLKPRSNGANFRVQVASYDVATGKVRHMFLLQLDTFCLSGTTDGRTLVISADRDREDAPARLFLFDTETGQTQDIPSKWFDADDHNPYAAISGDGRFVSAYGASGLSDGPPLAVRVYDWPTKKLIAEQVSAEPAGGFFWGGVTQDGKIAFTSNRTGSVILDMRTGRTLGEFGANSVRSPDGAWSVEFPNLLFGDTPKEAVIKNGINGEVVGKLDLQMTDDEFTSEWGGAFCGESERFVAVAVDAVRAYELPSGRQIAVFPPDSWRDPEAKGDWGASVACSSDGKRVAIRSGGRLALHDLK
jgi:hypothetical protein